MLVVFKPKLLAVLIAVLAVSLHVGLTSAQTAATVNVSQHAELGNILTDGAGMTLYLFTNDERNASNCAGGCATAWPPLLTAGDPVGGDGVADRLTTITRGDGGTQVVYNGWPLYYFAQDAAVGEAKGQNVGDNWFVVSTHGGPIQNNAPVNITAHAELGTFLVDISGRSQYLYTPDERNKSNCAGGCALFWPPLITVGDPVAGEGVNSRGVGTITRDDGYSQVTYNGWPLYYFVNDEKPGDTNGQDSRGVWYVVTTDGGAIWNNATVIASEDPELGTILTDEKGRVLYLYTPDERNISNCTGGCANAWPPLVTVGDPVAGDGAANRLGTITREDGYKQVTYNGWPLYYFFLDDKPGDKNGQDSRGVWYVLSTDGAAVWSTATVKASQHPTLGTILVDDKGRALYLFTRDEASTSNCNGGCALAWPPLVTANAPVAGDGVNGALLATTARAGGYTQVTYKGQPLYYFVRDGAPGDTAGQASGNVWFLLRPSGQALVFGFPSTGDTAVPTIALAALLAALLMVGAGGILVRRSRYAIG